MRYEFREGSSSKFWEARVEGQTLTTTWGRIGTDGQSKAKVFKDAVAAKKEHDSLVAEKLRKGYQATGPQPSTPSPSKPAPSKPAVSKAAVSKPAVSKPAVSKPAVSKPAVSKRAVSKSAPSKSAPSKSGVESSPSMPAVAHNDKLEAAILADRSREQPWLVYADFLQDQGDPRGELASLQAAKLSPAADKFLWARRGHFFGPLVPMLAPFTKDNARHRAVTATWRHGWMDSLRLSAASGSSSTRQLKRGKRPIVMLYTLGHPRLAAQFKEEKLPARFAAMPCYVFESKATKRSTLFTRLIEVPLPKAEEKRAHKVREAIVQTALGALPLKDGEDADTGFHTSASLEQVAASFKADGFEVVHLDDVYSRVADVDQVTELVTLLPDLTSARLLRELILGGPGEGGKFEPALKALVKAAPSLQPLERLFIGDFDSEDSELSWTSLGNPGPLFKAFPKLKALTLRAGKMTLGTIVHSSLEELTVITGGLSRESLESITTAKLPKLHTLSVWTGMNGYGGTCRLEDLEALLESPVLAHVKHLGLKNCELGDEVVALLAKSKVLSRLESLDLSKSHLTQAAVSTITSNAKAFSRLARLDVSDGILAKSAEPALKSVVKGLAFGKQDPAWWGLAEGVRYAAVGE